MRRLAGVLAPVIAALAIAGPALAGATGYTGYAGPWQWMAGQSAGSSYKSSWWRNAFNKVCCFDATVTFIDNVSYSWHNTVRNKEEITYTVWFSSQVKKAHCKSHASYVWGGCWVFD